MDNERSVVAGEWSGEDPAAAKERLAEIKRIIAPVFAEPVFGAGQYKGPETGADRLRME